MSLRVVSGRRPVLSASGGLRCGWILIHLGVCFTIILGHILYIQKVGARNVYCKKSGQKMYIAKSLGQKMYNVRGNTREKGGNPEKCVRGFPVLHSEADPGGTSRKTVFLERELGNGRQAAGLRSSRLGRAPRSGWLTGQRVFQLGQAGRTGQLND